MKRVEERKKMKRVDDLELRLSKHNNAYELVQWFTANGEEKESCMVIALFEEADGGCSIRFVGNRPFTIGKDETVWSMLKYGHAIADAEIQLNWEVNHS